MIAWLLVGGITGAMSGYATDGSWALMGGLGVLGVALAARSVLVANLIAVPAMMDEELRAQLVDQASQAELDELRREVANKIQGFIVEARTLGERIAAGQCGGREQVENAVEQWCGRLRSEVCIPYGLELEWWEIYEPPHIEENLGVTGRILRILAIRRERLSKLLLRCSRSDAHPIRPRSPG